MRINPALRVAAIPAVLGSLALSAHTQTISLSVNPQAVGVTTDLNRLEPGDVLFFELAVVIDPDADPLGRPGIGNRGLAALVYDVTSAEAISKSYFLNGMQDAFSGFNINGEPVAMSSPFYAPSESTGPNYGGGWGFDRSGLPGGGDVTGNPGAIIGAAIAATPSYQADVNPNSPGQQPNIRLDVGIGLFTFPDDDPVAGGEGDDFFNNIIDVPNPPREWVIQFGVIDTTGWEPDTYNFEILPSAGELFDGALDYTMDHADGFAIDVPLANTSGTSFSFTLIETCSSTCGDINGSGGLVNLFDFAALALCFGESAPTSQVCACSDLNSDGSINMFDFATFSLLFGTTSTNLPPNCP